METTLGSAAERRQNGADRPFPELCLAHWYARLPEMKTPGLEGKEMARPGRSVCLGGWWHSSESLGSCLAEAGMGEGHAGMIATLKQLPLYTLFWKSCKIRVPLPLCNTKGSAQFFAWGNAHYAFIFILFWGILYILESWPLCTLEGIQQCDKPLGAGHWGERNISSLGPYSWLKPIIKELPLLVWSRVVFPASSPAGKRAKNVDR